VEQKHFTEPGSGNNSSHHLQLWFYYHPTEDLPTRQMG